MTAERLDQIEDEMETIKQILGAAARMAERNSKSIDRVTDRIDRLTSTIDRLAVSQLNTEERVDQLAVSQLNLEETMNRFIQNAEADRTVMREIQTEVRGLQIENRRMMDHLFGQQEGT